MTILRKIKRHMPIFILIAGVILSIWVLIAGYQAKRSESENKFQAASAERINAIQLRLEQAQTFLVAVETFYDSSAEVDRGEFHSYTTSFFQSDTTVKAVGWAPAVKYEDRAAFEAKAGSEMGEDYKIIEKDFDNNPVAALPRALYLPVNFLEPREGNSSWAGFDLASDFLLWQDARQAAVTGKTVISHAYHPDSRKLSEYDLLFMRAVYKRNAVLENETDRRNNRIGLVVAVYRMHDIVEESLRHLTPFGIHIAFYDELAGPGEQLLYFHESRKFATPNDFKVSQRADEVFLNHYQKTIDIGMRKWKIVCMPARAYWSVWSFWQPWAGALVSLIITLLTAFSVFLYQQRHERFEKLVSDRTKELQETQQNLLSEVSSRRDAEERLQLFIENAPVAVAMFDTKMCYLVTSRRWIDDLGLKGKEIIGRSHYEVFPEKGDMPLLLEIYQIGLKGACLKKEEELFVHRGGKNEWLRWEIHPWFKPDQTVGGLIMYIEQITARKEAEFRLKEKDEMLQQSQKMEAIGRLAGGVAHDFNNQLTVIKGFAAFLEKTLTGSDEKIFVEEIQIASERAARLTAQLLAFSRKQILNPVVIQPNEVLTGMTEMIKRLISEEIEYFFRGDPETGLIQIDRGQLEQILVTLVVNAQDATPAGGSILVETANETVEPAWAESHPGLNAGDYVVIMVTDSGSGIAPDVLPNIFEPFFTTKEKGKGTGLGLATCFGIIKQQGGHITVDTELGKGTRFKVYLPQLSGKKNAPDVILSGSLEDLPRATETILLCEDEPALRFVLKETLTGQGYIVLEAADGELGWRQITKTGGDAIDLIVSDVIMPRMNGRELMKKVLESYPRIPILLISGYTDNFDMSEDFAAGKVSFMQKPFEPEDLLLQVHSILRSKEKRKDLAS